MFGQLCFVPGIVPVEPLAAGADEALGAGLAAMTTDTPPTVRRPIARTAVATILRRPPRPVVVGGSAVVDGGAGAGVAAGGPSVASFAASPSDGAGCQLRSMCRLLDGYASR